MALRFLVGLLPHIRQREWQKLLATMVGAKTQDGIKLPPQHLMTIICQPTKNPPKSYVL
jgi:hypothetical protein